MRPSEDVPDMVGSGVAEDQSGWQGSSWSTGGDPPLPRLPLQPPRWDDGCSDGDSAAESRTLLVMEYADQRSLHTSICRGRLKGELVSHLRTAGLVISTLLVLNGFLNGLGTFSTWVPCDRGAVFEAILFQAFFAKSSLQSHCIGAVYFAGALQGTQTLLPHLDI